MKNFLLSSLLLLLGTVTAQDTIYVDLDATGSNPAGTFLDPYNDIAAASDSIYKMGGGYVLIKRGDYDLTSRIDIETPAPSDSAVIIKPVEGIGSVSFNFRNRIAFFFTDTSSHITLEGVEIDGGTDENVFWDVVALDFWSVAGNPAGGGLAVILDGENITIKDCYLHDCYQKGVEIRGGRYVVVEGCIIENIAHNSLSGGHGIMRQQIGREFFTDDDADVFRWDLRENMIFNVEQRIYSWVPGKGFIDMLIDEGKSILIDDPKDSDGEQERMSARIKNNVIAFGAVDHIRLKSTPNLTVSNNSIYSEGEDADGITDKKGDTPTPQFTNFVCENNATHVFFKRTTFGIEIDDCIKQTEAADGVPVISNNYSVGRIKALGRAGVTQLPNNRQLFVDPNNGDFTINPMLGIAPTGVETEVLDSLDSKATAYDVDIGWDGWLTDNLRLTQTILDNIPGVDDGVAGNETVLKDDGKLDTLTKAGRLRTIIKFDVINSDGDPSRQGTDWQSQRRSALTQKFELGFIYAAWYNERDTTYFQEGSTTTDTIFYERIRYGDSEIRQDRVYKPTWLTVSAISPERTTIINAPDHDLILNGDILIEFNDTIPMVGDTFTLMRAASITSDVVPDVAARNVSSTGDGTDLFNQVRFPDGQEPDNYTLEVLTEDGKDVLRLTILAALPVELLSFTGEVAGKQNHLSWETTSELDNDFFDVERSAAGSQWLTLGRVAAVADGRAGGAYGFADVAPLSGTNLYRLRQVDVDGTFAYSGIVRLNGRTTESLRIFPNPAAGQFTVITSASRDRIRLLNAIGQDVTNQVSIAARPDGVQVSYTNLKPGIYLLDTGAEVSKVDLR